MLSKAQIKYIRSLTQQKYRKQHNQFLVEGDKMAAEWLESRASVRMIVALEDWIKSHEQLIARHPDAELYPVSGSVLESITALQTSNQVLLTVEMPALPAAWPEIEWTLALDTIRDPGNMGTLIRIADWFGIRHLVCSPGCADIYNPKVVQAAMGSHLRVLVHEAELLPFVRSVKMPVLAAALSGRNVYGMPPFEKAVLIIGNESKGLAPELLEASTDKVSIPRRGGAESLNAAVSAGILCALLAPR